MDRMPFTRTQNREHSLSVRVTAREELSEPWPDLVVIALVVLLAAVDIKTLAGPEALLK
jgi:hypothetical protein